MAKSGYTITKSNYTIKKAHNNTSDGTVYERDFMATNNLGGWNSGSIPNSENGFKMVYRNGDALMRQHHFGDFLKNENGSDIWTLNSGATQSEVGEDSKIVLKTDNSTLSSYAYYGNCVQLIQSSIRKIINNFPSEMYSTSKEIEDGVFTTINDIKYYFYNDFDIDITTIKLNENILNDVNKLRYFALSSARYMLFFQKEDGTWESEGCITNWHVIVPSFNCEYDREIIIGTKKRTIKIRRYLFNNEPLYLTNTPNVKIRLSDSDIESFFNSIDDFQRVLLNRDTIPIYTAKLDYLYETDKGVIETYKKSFTWPTTNGWNLDITSKKYEKYIESLLNLASFYDEYYTDNLWKNMTHDSIKNMDITFSRKNSDEDIDDYNEGTSKVQGVLWACGRLFDEIKRYIDNIKAINTITYDNNGNLPNYFLTDNLNLHGWEITSAVNGLKKNNTINNLFDGFPKEYTVDDANIVFLKNLKLNSKNIFSKKGTRKGIESILGVFGLISDDYVKEITNNDFINGDYKLTEYIVEADTKNKDFMRTESNNLLPAEIYNNYKENISTDNPDNQQKDTLEGLPVMLYYYKKNNVLMKTIVPWFKSMGELDGKPYFQLYGGWGKISGLTENTSSYTETIGYLQIVKNYSDLNRIPKSKLLKKDYNIVYVDEIRDTDSSHYFIKEGDNDWQEISETDTKVIELKNIIDEYRGNNPHTGFGNYDDGKEYLKMFENIFYFTEKEGLFTDDAYDCKDGELIDDIGRQGFNLTTHIDNKKCYYFYDLDEYDVSDKMGLRRLIPKGTTFQDVDMGLVNGSPWGEDVTNTNKGKNTIQSEYSIINVKNFGVEFFIKNNDEKNYIQNSVVPYLMQMVPSTTILNISYVNNKIDYITLPWKEDFLGDLSMYTLVDGGSQTKMIEESVAGGTSPELLISKLNGSFGAKLKANGGEYRLTFMSNHGNYLDVNVSDKNIKKETIKISTAKGINEYIFTVPNSGSIFALTITNTNNNNARIDDIEFVPKIPILTIKNTNISVKGVETNVNLEYSVKDAIEGGTITAQSSASWVKSFNYDEANNISFIVEENDGEERSATITFTYTGAESVVVSIKQLKKDALPVEKTEEYVFTSFTPDSSGNTTLNIKDKFSIILQKNNKQSSAPAYSTAQGGGVRLYAHNTMEITSIYKIIKIELPYIKNNGKGGVIPDILSFKGEKVNGIFEDDGKTLNWRSDEGDNNIILTRGSNSGNYQISKVKVIYLEAF